MTRLIVDPLTRVEGHGRVELILKDGHLDDVEVHLLESPRLFESLVVGRSYDEVPDLISRICSICSAAHKLTALRALETVMAIEIPPIAATLRELLLLGGHIQSHALHLFCLILPDLRGTPDILELLRQKDPMAQTGIALKAFGNHIQTIAGGRVVHPINPIFGGVAYFPDSLEIKRLVEEVCLWQRDWPGLSQQFLQFGNYPEASPAIGNAIATGSEQSFALTGNVIRCEKGDNISVDNYAQLLQERPRADSHAKDSTGETGPFLTGAMARSRLTTEKHLRLDLSTEPLGIHGNNIAQVIEINQALERVAQLLENLSGADRSGPLQTVLKETQGGIGTAATEAPRGLLIHHYVVDEWGTVVAADIVTPTAINQRVIAAQIMADLANEEDHEKLMNVTERIVRAYDPCISCAVHLITGADAARTGQKKR